MSDTDNPIITCTQMQLAFVAWQVRRADYDVDKAVLDPSGPSWDAFQTWWSRNEIAGWPVSNSLRGLCAAAWVAAKPIEETPGDDLQHFNAWWQTIVDGQPKIGGVP